jgi:hypothetical protein
MKKIIEYRLTPSSLGMLKYLQFKSTFKILFWTFDCWRYVPISWVARCFKESDCPILGLPFTTSHCFACFYSRKDAIDWIKNHINIHEHFEKLKQDYEDTKKNIYLN